MGSTEWMTELWWHCVQCPCLHFCHTFAGLPTSSMDCSLSMENNKRPGLHVEFDRIYDFIWIHAYRMYVLFVEPFPSPFQGAGSRILHKQKKILSKLEFANPQPLKSLKTQM